MSRTYNKTHFFQNNYLLAFNFTHLHKLHQFLLGFFSHQPKNATIISFLYTSMCLSLYMHVQVTIIYREKSHISHPVCFSGFMYLIHIHDFVWVFNLENHVTSCQHLFGSNWSEIISFPHKLIQIFLVFEALSPRKNIFQHYMNCNKYHFAFVQT